MLHSVKRMSFSGRISCIVLVLLLSLAGYSAQAQCGCTHIIPLNPSAYIIDGAVLKAINGTIGVKPGDKVCFATGTRPDLLIKNMNGTAAQPITITNMCDGQVKISANPGTGRLVYVGNCSHIHFTGAANPAVQYGIEITSGVMGIDFRDFTTQVEADHLYIHDIGYAGIVAKTDPTCDPATWRGNGFIMRDVYFHENYIKNTLGEGFYVGDSHYHTTFPVTCGGVVIQTQESSIMGVEIAYNKLENIGRDGIQVGSGVKPDALSKIQGVFIHHNTINGFGATNEYAQQSGLQINPGTDTECYNNVVDTGTGFALFAGGQGGSHFYNNILANALQGGIIAASYLPYDPAGFVFTNNTLVNNSVYGIYMLAENGIQNLFANNIIIAPAGQPSFQYVRLNNPPAIKWTDVNNIKTNVAASVKLANIPGKDYHILAGSPAIDAGKDVSALGVTFDLDGKPRPKGTGYDIGAYEIQPNGPTSNAGVDKTITLPTNSLSITGIGTSSTGVTGYNWTEKSGAAATITNGTTATVTIGGLAAGNYVFTLEVKDASGSAFDDVSVTVLPAAVNKSPTAAAGADKIVTLPINSITLNGTGADQDGTVVSYKWTQTSGTPASFTGNLTPNLSLTALTAGVYGFTLLVTDNLGATGSDDVIVTVNAATVNQLPVVNAGVDKTIYLPITQVTLGATASDPDGSISLILWELKSGAVVNITGAGTLTPTITGLALGNYTFRITVTDNLLATKFDEINVQVLNGNQNPTAHAGNDINVTLPTTTTNIVGSGTDPDGSISLYSWAQIGGNPATLVNAGSPTLTVNGLALGTYVFELTVTDNQSAIAKDQVNVVVSAAPVNQAPLVNAGVDASIVLPLNTVILNGTASDPDGTISLVAWSQKNGPSIATLVNAGTLGLTVQNMVAGSYTFTLKATDNLLLSSTDDVIVVVLPPTVNKAPVANAGSNKFITLPTNSVNLSGIATDPDGTISSVEWSQVSGPSTATLGPINVNTIAISNLLAGQYVFNFKATDNLLTSSNDQVTVSVSASNLPPLVDAGPDKFITLPVSSVTVNAIASDPDGTINIYTWTQIAGPGATISGDATANLQLDNLTAGTYVFQITVTDNSLATKSDMVTINVLTASSNQLPLVSAGSNFGIQLPTNSIVLNGSASDPDGSIATLLWAKQSGPAATLTNTGTVSLTATGLTPGVYVFRLTATDNVGGESYAETTVTVSALGANQKPIANSGGNKILQLPTNSIVLNGSGSDSDGTISAFLWEKVSGPAATFTTTNAAALQLSGLVEGIYVFKFTVTDNSGDTGSDLATITVIPATVNHNPDADAGTNQFITLPVNSVTLAGSGFDSDGSIAGYNWAIVSGPGGQIITNPGSQVTSVTGLSLGVYVFRFTVTDNLGANGFDDVSVTVGDGTGNSLPIANAGGNQNISLPTTAINLNGTGVDLDGSIVLYKWTQVSGAPVTLTNTGNAVLSVSNLVAGQFVFQLTVTDNSGATDTDNATITVTSQAANNAPLVYAGGNKILKSPAASIVLTGSATDLDGTISKVAWSQISGSPSTLGATDGLTFSISGLTEGVYIFRLTATDNSSASSFDQMTLTVAPASSNTPPVVNAGTDIVINLPIATATTNASASDDGTIASYLWSQSSGPNIATLSDVSKLNITASSLIAGVYVFKLTVTDNNTAFTSDDVMITVLPAGINQAPKVDAGTDQEIVLPTNVTTLTGTATDPDGTISTLQWTQVSGPTATLGAIDALSLNLSNMLVGSYTFKLTAKDNSGASSSANVTVVVDPVPPNKPPVVDAGNNVAIILPASTVSLTATASDPDGSVASVAWSQKQGPNTANFATPKALASSVSGLIAGTYIFRLSATDNLGLVGFGDVIVFVSNDSVAAAKQAPIAYAGDDITITLPDNEVTIVGEAVDASGFIQTYTWDQIAGPKATFTTTVSRLNVTDLTAGKYTFVLTATDDKFLSGSDSVNIFVIEKVNEIPKFFSPNNDQIGDLWVFRNIESYQQCGVAVFNREGRQVFAASPYQNNWDGNANGKPLNDGDYYYVIKCDDGRVEKGAVRLIR